MMYVDYRIKKFSIILILDVLVLIREFYLFITVINLRISGAIFSMSFLFMVNGGRILGHQVLESGTPLGRTVVCLLLIMV